jgi:hypothetical protein
VWDQGGESHQFSTDLINQLIKSII